jgi:AAA+ superfamily predicted ATPase
MTERLTPDDLFERRLSYPDRDAAKRFARLVGIDEAKARLTKLLRLLVNPGALEAWAKRYHSNADLLLDYVERKPPLVVLAGDVGSGKTELAECIGDPVARLEGISVTLYPLSLSARGTGVVGEMTHLISSAFAATIDAAEKLARGSNKSTGAVVLLVDEADSLTESRANQHMHHEDRTGVNAFIRGVDRLAQKRLPAAVILCTNRLSAIDSAVRRRAAELFEFGRPNAEQRRAVLAPSLSELGFTETQIAELVELTGIRNGPSTSFTFSDLTQRFLPALVLDAYPDHAITFEGATRIAMAIQPTPVFGMTNTQQD